MKYSFLLLFGLLIGQQALATPAISLSSTQDNGATWLLIQAEGLEDAYGFDLIVEYDGQKLSVADTRADQSGTQIQSGELFSDNAFEITNAVDLRQHRIRLARSILNPAPAVNGAGTIAAIPFNGNEAAEIRVIQADFGTREGRIMHATLPAATLIQPTPATAEKSKFSPLPLQNLALHKTSSEEHRWLYLGAGVLVLLTIINVLLLVQRKRRHSDPAA